MDTHVERPKASIAPNSNLRRRWRVITALILAGSFIQACFAGAMLSGAGWAWKAHSATAAFLIAATIAAGLISIVTLRRIPHGPKLGLTLLSLAAVVCIQAAIGALSAKGANLLWVHVPLGVAVFGAAARGVADARKLGGG